MLFQQLQFDVTFYIKAMVFIDFCAVSLIVPLLSSYFRDAGVDTKSYGLIMSLYNISQLVGGVVMGFLADNMSKRDVLLLSFTGSAISYLLVGTSKSWVVLFGSRILVGLVKQTISTSTAAITELTPSQLEKRTRDLGHISALATTAFIFGPSVGGILYKAHKCIPAIVAAGCFLLNASVCIWLMPSNEIMIAKKTTSENVTSENGQAVFFGWSRIRQSMRDFIKSAEEILKFRHLFQSITTVVCINFVESSMSPRNVINYFETKFGVETFQLGFISSGSMCLTVFAQTFLIGPILKVFASTKQPQNDTQSISGNLSSGGQQNTNNSPLVPMAVAIMLVAAVLEHQSSELYTYIGLSLIPYNLASTVLSVSSRSEFTDSIPPGHIGKALGLLNVITTGLGIVTPLYGAYVFAYFGGAQNKALVAAIHLVALLGAIVGLRFIAGDVSHRHHDLPQENKSHESVEKERDDDVVKNPVATVNISAKEIANAKKTN